MCALRTTLHLFYRGSGCSTNQFTKTIIKIGGSISVNKNEIFEFALNTIKEFYSQPNVLFSKDILCSIL